MQGIKLDEHDYSLLSSLNKDARQTIAELSTELGIPRATVHERIVRMKKAGVIKRFTIEQDYTKIGLPTLSFVFAAYDQSVKSNQHSVAERIGKISGVLGVYIISGEWDLLIKIRGKSIEDIGTVILDQIRETPGVIKTYTMACFDMVKDSL
ncbi:Lrp/AsnC family transcriptional regulator [Candidatus Micrarchaeota archaeon]|nr:Lrp/AsnC family transcriptional regulator [Candidatus Micrarchaeota archaeon]